MIRGLATVIALSGSALALYLAGAMLGALVPVNRTYVAPLSGTPVWLCSNGIHTDLVLPAQDPVDWLAVLPPGLVKMKPGPGMALSFGWGDRDFYIDTPYWYDLKPMTAVRAILGGDATVVHVEARPVPGVDAGCDRILLDPGRLSRLEDYIRSAMANDRRGRPMPIIGAHYDAADGFVVGTGHYSIILTCNEWLRQGLAQAGIRTALWSPFPFGMHWQRERR